jgi:hypothetical protein
MGITMFRISTTAAAGLLLLPVPLSAQTTETSESRSQREAEEEQRASRPVSTGSNWRLFAYTGASYSRGDYGTELETETLAIPLGVRLRKGGLRLSASIPYLRIEGSRTVIPGDGDEIVEDAPVQRAVREGFGDLSLRARYRIDDLPGGFRSDLTGRIKVPTASASERLGTGEFDFGLGGEISRPTGRLEPFAELNYRINGDPPDRDYRNTLQAAVGTSLRLGRSVASLSYDYSQSRIRGREASHSLDFSLATPLSRRLLLAGFASAGLSERAPDFGVGAVLTVRAF